MEREHAVITQMWDYCKQCEDIVIVSKTRKTFLGHHLQTDLEEIKKTIARTFFPFHLLEQLLPLSGGGSRVPLLFFQFFLFKNHLESLPECQNDHSPIIVYAYQLLTDSLTH